MMAEESNSFMEYYKQMAPEIFESNTKIDKFIKDSMIKIYDRVSDANKDFPNKRMMAYKVLDRFMEKTGQIIFLKGIRNIGKTVLINQLAFVMGAAFIIQGDEIDEWLSTDSSLSIYSLFRRLKGNGFITVLIDEACKISNEGDLYSALKYYGSSMNILVTGSSSIAIEDMCFKCGRGEVLTMPPITYTEYVAIKNNLATNFSINPYKLENIAMINAKSNSDELKEYMYTNYVDEAYYVEYVRKNLEDTIESNYRRNRYVDNISELDLRLTLELVCYRTILVLNKNDIFKNTVYEVIIEFLSEKYSTRLTEQELKQLQDIDLGQVFRKKYEVVRNKLDSNKLYELVTFLEGSGLIGIDFSYNAIGINGSSSWNKSSLDFQSFKEAVNKNNLLVGDSRVDSLLLFPSTVSFTTYVYYIIFKDIHDYLGLTCDYEILKDFYTSEVSNLKGNLFEVLVYSSFLDILPLDKIGKYRDGVFRKVDLILRMKNNIGIEIKNRNKNNITKVNFKNYDSLIKEGVLDKILILQTLDGVEHKLTDKIVKVEGDKIINLCLSCAYNDKDNDKEEALNKMLMEY